MALAAIALASSILYLLLSQFVQQVAPNTLFYLRFAALLAFGTFLIHSLYDLTARIVSILPKELIPFCSMFRLTALILNQGGLCSFLKLTAYDFFYCRTIHCCLKCREYKSRY